ncbi:tyrosine-type recombinase/integrase [Methylobacterium sp. WL103]|uniref:DUF6538 domain-containing protein n=1 Tax=Methylobacterium sp. WL103 TaxID=2603891 RepID=UPI0011C9CE77|nr:DUF6538 domain-containing protein [Methylobacterium sp. WL103]TXM96331.1 tyrosine-type recombinase/integrase [Methylobacterium sp. WL103]
MALAANLHRRGAVYYWRRRMPAKFALATGANWLKLSLRTREPVRARFLAAQLDATAADLFMTTMPDAITKEQLATLFRKAFLGHEAKLDRVAAFARQEPGFDPVAEMASERAMGWSYRVASVKGVNGRLGEDDHAAMAKAGLAEIEIAGVEECLDTMQRSGALAPSKARIREIIEDVGALPTPGNVARAEPIYLRALGEALLRTRDRFVSDALPYDDLIAALGTEACKVESERRVAEPFAAVADPITVPSVPQPIASSAPPLAPNSAPAGASTVTINAIGVKLIAEKRQDGEWDDKTCRQAEFIFTLFGRFLREEHGLTDLAGLRQTHCDAFDGLLRALFKSVGKSPKDKHRSIRDLRRISEAKKPDERGLASGTRDRHLTFLGQALVRARKAGVAIDLSVSLTEFRARKKKRGRDQRPTPPSTALETFFSLPVFTGCRAWNDMHTAGPELFHRAAYFGPMLAHYEGMRREEFCALSVEDVINSNGEHPYLHVCFNEFGRVKNTQSVRNLALHPELVRLGFLDYVTALLRSGHKRDFPNLFSPSTRGLLGDRLYDELRPAFTKAGFTTHQVRHHFGNALKQQRVAEEFRADLLGHGGKTETTERYCNPIGIKLQLEELTKLPVLTAHLKPKPIRLVPWVERGEIAPWSHASRRRAASSPARRVRE